AQILNTVSQLKYRYDDEPVFVCDQWPTEKIVRAEHPLTKSEVVTSVKQPTTLGDSRQDVPLALPSEVKEKLTQSRAKKFENERLILQLRNIEYDEPVGI